MVKMSNVRSVDSRRSKSMMGIVMLVFESRDGVAEVGAVSCDATLLWIAIRTTVGRDISSLTRCGYPALSCSLDGMEAPTAWCYL